MKIENTYHSVDWFIEPGGHLLVVRPDLTEDSLAGLPEGVRVRQNDLGGAGGRLGGCGLLPLAGRGLFGGGFFGLFSPFGGWMILISMCRKCGYVLVAEWKRKRERLR